MWQATPSKEIWVYLSRKCFATVISIALALSATTAATFASDGASSTANAVGEEIPTGKAITPTAAAGALFQDLNPGNPAAPDARADQAVAVAVSPDGKYLAILTSGFNVFSGPDGKTTPELSAEHIFLFDITGPRPKQLQVLSLPNSFQGLAWAPSSERLFASGGKDDTVWEFVRAESTFSAGRVFHLGHQTGLGLNVTPIVGSLAVSPDGTRLLVANLENDSVSLIDLASGQLLAEQDLRPGIIDPRRRGQPGGTFPRSVTWTSVNHAYVASERDREIVSLSVAHDKFRVVRRMPVRGQPVALLSNRRGTRLYAALDTTSQIAIFDARRDSLIESLDVTAPESIYANKTLLGGANTNALALTRDEGTLLVGNGGENALAVVHLGDLARDISRKRAKPDDDDDEKAGLSRSVVAGLVPTGWYPTGVAVSRDAATWYVVNGKSPAGPNVSWCKRVDTARNRCVPDKSPPVKYAPTGMSLLFADNQYIHQLEKSGFLSFPAPGPLELARLTKQVAHNNHFDKPRRTAAYQQLFSFLREHIKHVIYIIKENRSYDQVLGDLQPGNGDPRLTLFPESISPNHHALARNFITLDNFLVSGEVSWTGWDYAVSAQTTDFREHQEPLAMRGALTGDRGVPPDHATNRNINVGYATSAERAAAFSRSPSDPDILPGTRSIYAPDAPGGEEGTGYIWDAALRAGKTVRNWGFYGDQRTANPANLQLVHDPYEQQLRVFYPGKTSLMPYSDPYYADVYSGYPDFWRVKEWKREFAQFVARGEAPNLMLVWVSNDHFGSFDRAIDGVNTPETQMADNDYALGLIVEAVSRSRFARDTLIISIEDDACDGPDHVDAHRSIALFAGPYVRQRALLSTRYTTVSVLKTIEEILGVGPIGLNDALAEPMSEVFDPSKTDWSYEAIVPDVLRSTQLPLPPSQHASNTRPRHSAQYWTKAMAGQDFSGPDRIDPITFNRALWRGLKGDVPYPTRSEP